MRFLIPSTGGLRCLKNDNSTHKPKIMNTLVGKKIRTLRKQKGLSQEQVADHLHISQSTYARIESGESHSWASYIEPISMLFEIQPEELIKQEIVRVDKIETNNGAIFNVGIINQLSEKVSELFEQRLLDKDAMILLLKETNTSLQEIIKSLKA